jgi:2-keto-4-pentenoate hydratase
MSTPGSDGNSRPLDGAGGADEDGGGNVVDRAVRRLAAAAASGVPCAPVRDLIGSAASNAYEVQERATQLRLRDGATIVGRKIGLTSQAARDQFGVDEPDIGVLFDDMSRPDGATVSLDELIQPMVEAEVAFVLGDDLVDGELDVARVRAAVRECRAAFEIVDSRIATWDITIADTIADNGSSGLFVLSETGRTLDEVEPAEVEMEVRRDGEVVSSGRGDACLGDPLDALVWLAQTARELGRPLRSGEVVLSGALGPMVVVAGGEHFVAEMTGLGTVSVSFDVRGEDAATTTP